MQLVFPTNFGENEFYTVVNLKNIEIDTIEIVDKNSNTLRSSNPDTFLIKKAPNNDSFSITDLNLSFYKDKSMINNSIDNYIFSTFKGKK